MEEYLNEIYDNIAIIGLETYNLPYEKFQENTLQPQLIDVFPNYPKSKNIDQFLQWCFPKGFCIYDSNLQQINLNSKNNTNINQQQIVDLNNLNNIHHFVICDEKRKKKYCSCLTVYEKVVCLNNQQEQIKIFVPKLLAMFSKQALFEPNKQYLNFLYKNIFYPRIIKTEKNIKIPEEYFEQFQNLVQNHGFEKAFKQWDEIYMKMKLSVKLHENTPMHNLVSQDCLLEFFISILFSKQQFPFESQGLQIQSPSLKENESILLNVYNGSKYFTVDNFNIQIIFEKVHVQNILNLIQAILLERQIIIFADQPLDLIHICESLITLIFPMQWNGQYMPILPQKLFTLIDSKTPFIFGISKSDKQMVMTKLNIQNKVIFDIEENTLIDQQCLYFPQKLNNYLSDGLNECLKKKLFTPENLMNIKRIVFNFFWGLINNIIPFFLYSTLTENEIIKSKCEDIFDIEDYLKIFPQEEKSFMKELSIHSQFMNFIQDSFRILHQTEFQKQNFIPKTAYEHKLLYFLQFSKKINQKISQKNCEHYVDIMTNPYFLSLEVENKMEIKKQLQQLSQPHKIDLQLYLIKYIFYLQYNNENNQEKYDYEQLDLIQQKNNDNQILRKLNRQRFIPMQMLNNNNVKNNIKQNSNIQQNNIKQNSNIQQNNYSLQQIQQKNIISSYNSKNINNLNKMEVSFSQSQIDSQNINQDQIDENIQIQNILLFYNKEEMEYDSFQNRKFIHQFEKLRMIYPKIVQKNYQIQKKNLSGKNKSKLFEISPFNISNFGSEIFQRDSNQSNKLPHQNISEISYSTTQHLHEKSSLDQIIIDNLTENKLNVGYSYREQQKNSNQKNLIESKSELPFMYNIKKEVENLLIESQDIVIKKKVYKKNNIFIEKKQTNFFGQQEQIINEQKQNFQKQKKNNIFQNEEENKFINKENFIKIPSSAKNQQKKEIFNQFESNIQKLEINLLEPIKEQRQGSIDYKQFKNQNEESKKSFHNSQKIQDIKRITSSSMHSQDNKNIQKSQQNIYQKQHIIDSNSKVKKTEYSKPPIKSNQVIGQNNQYDKSKNLQGQLN